MTQLQNQTKVTLSHVCVSMQSVQYCSSHLSHMDIFLGSDLVRQRAQTSPSSPTTSSSSLSSCVGQSIHVQVRVPTDHIEGTLPVFESKIAANARAHARTHATPYRIPSICSLRCPSATCVQTSAQYRNHEHHCTPFAARSTSFLNSTGRKCYITPAFSGVPNKRNKIRSQNLRYGSP